MEETKYTKKHEKSDTLKKKLDSHIRNHPN